MEDDTFDHVEPSPEDLEDSKIRNEVTFDIEVSSETNKKIALEFFSTMYKRHFLSLFVGGCIAVVILFIAFALFGSVTWVGAYTERRMALNGGLMAMPVAMLLVMPFLERSIYSRDQWTLDRLGVQPLGRSRSRGAYMMALVPLAFLLIGLFDASWQINPAFINPVYFFFLVGGIPVVVVEEVIFRGVYWKYLFIRFARTHSSWPVFLVNAFFFSAIHLPTIFVLYSEGVLANTLSYIMPTLALYLASYFTSGLILCTLRDAFKNLLAPISYHVAFNLVFFIFQVNMLWIIIFQGIILLILLLGRKMGWFNPFVPGAGATLDPEYNKPILDTKIHALVRLAFWAGNGIVLFYYGSEMARGNDMLLSLVSILVIASYVLVGILYAKRAFIFKIPEGRS